jgi:hypothetical protein
VTGIIASEAAHRNMSLLSRGSMRQVGSSLLAMQMIRADRHAGRSELESVWGATRRRLLQTHNTGNILDCESLRVRKGLDVDFRHIAGSLAR